MSLLLHPHCHYFGPGCDYLQTDFYDRILAFVLVRPTHILHAIRPISPLYETESSHSPV